MYTAKTSEYPDESYYYVGKWGDKGIPVVIVQTTMGCNGPNGSYNETKKALSCLPNLKYIFAVGVCGGVKDKVKLGDVVVSKVLQDCSDDKVTDDKVIIRSAGWSLVGKRFYHFLSQAANKPDIMRCGMVMSTNRLVADANFQKKLLVACPEAIAFEMEGHGIARACEESTKKIEYLVVKGVSDLADEDKVDDWQPQAAINAVNALYEVMAKYDAFGKIWLVTCRYITINVVAIDVIYTLILLAFMSINFSEFKYPQKVKIKFVYIFTSICMKMLKLIQAKLNC